MKLKKWIYIINYKWPVGLDGRMELRNMNTFIEIYKEALFIAKLNYGKHNNTIKMILGKNWWKNYYPL